MAADAAAIAFPEWAELGPGARRTLLNKAADAIQSRGEEFASAMIEETGATAAWAVFNVALASGIGVVLGIAPWNAPLILGVRAIAMPLACGNTAVLKASELGLAMGAIRVVGSEGSGVLMSASVIDHVTAGMKLYSDESFGPVVAVIRATNESDAIRLANDTEYGLSAAVFSRNVNRALKVAKQIESGICHINGPTVQDEAQMPFGGVKASGYGRFGGKAGIAEFTNLRWVTIQTTEGHFPI